MVGLGHSLVERLWHLFFVSQTIDDNSLTEASALDMMLLVIIHA